LSPLNSRVLASREKRDCGNLVVDLASPSIGRVVASSDSLVEPGDLVFFAKHSVEDLPKGSYGDSFLIKCKNIIAKIVDSKAEPLNGHLLLEFDEDVNSSIIIPEEAKAKQSVARVVSLSKDAGDKLSGRVGCGDHVYFAKWSIKSADDIMSPIGDRKRFAFIKQDDIMAVKNSETNIELLNGNILLKYEPSEAGPIIIPDSAKTRQSMAVILMLPAVLDDKISGKIQVGDSVYFEKYSDLSLKGTGKQIVVNGEQLDLEKTAMVNQSKLTLCCRETCKK
jgi:co-chaperonin GroES (HSP10)